MRSSTPKFSFARAEETSVSSVEAGERIECAKVFGSKEGERKVEYWERGSGGEGRGRESIRRERGGGGVVMVVVVGEVDPAAG